MKRNYMDVLLYYINNGITLEDGTTKKFDIVDYYQYFEQNILDVFRGCRDIEVRVVLKKFIIENLGSVCFGGKNIKGNIVNNHNVQALLESNIVYNVEFDEQGNYIVGSGYTISDEEKQEAYEFLERYNGVVTEKGLDIIFKRIANGYPISEKVRGR